jgi:hypothetical protein
MFEIAVMNPRRSRKKRRSNPSMKRNKKGRFVKRSSNPRKKRRHPKRASNPRKHRKHRASNPRRKRRRHVARASNPRKHRRRRNPRRHRAHRRRNPRFLSGLQGGALGLLKEGAIGGAGALVNAVILGFGLPYLPTTFTTGYALDAVRIATATGLALVGKKFGGRMGEEAGKGAVAVAMYLLFRDVLVSMAPTLPLGDYEEISIDSTSDQIGAYMDPAQRLAGTGAYMSGFLPDGSRARGTGAYMGAYMSGAYNADDAYAESSDGFTLNGLDY